MSASGPPDPSIEARKLPKADRLLAAADRAGFVARLGHEPVMAAVRAELEGRRRAVLGGAPCPPAEAIEAALLARLADEGRGSLRRVVNATGVVIHTNLGRSPLSAATARAMAAAAEGYSNLEYDLAAGARGDRYHHAAGALGRLTGAEAAVAVNNCASAVLLSLAALSAARPSGEAPGDGPPEVIVSRGQLVEIGGGFRIPDVLRRSGAALVEVGTTNRTYARDVEEAITPRTRAVLAVHRSNFRLDGFVAEPSLEELVELGRRRDLWVVSDLGSGTLLPTAPYGLGDEPTVQSQVRAGADLVCFSGDKLLGGPQAGLLVGRAAAVVRVKRHPLLRALRLDKVTIAGLAATLAHYERGEALTELPIWRAIARPLAELEASARGWLEALGPEAPGARVRPSTSAVGGGTLPGETLPTAVLAVPTGEPDALLARLRRADPPVVARIEEGEVVLDPRTVQPGEDGWVVAALRAALAT
ncbi:MAG TPA: L-seryl-tRNA(Sec) selenium transferase [Anaeromyxobacteraceae bacterium]|nr:L-seryl-tRNA(Sec) selenium transferase [Anaeromyxobacteraceae bacterium]